MSWTCRCALPLPALPFSPHLIGAPHFPGSPVDGSPCEVEVPGPQSLAQPFLAGQRQAVAVVQVEAIEAVAGVVVVIVPPPSGMEPVSSPSALLVQLAGLNLTGRLPAEALLEPLRQPRLLGLTDWQENTLAGGLFRRHLAGDWVSLRKPLQMALEPVAGMLPDLALVLSTHWVRRCSKGRTRTPHL